VDSGTFRSTAASASISYHHLVMHPDDHRPLTDTHTQHTSFHSFAVAVKTKVTVGGLFFNRLSIMPSLVANFLKWKAGDCFVDTAFLLPSFASVCVSVCTVRALTFESLDLGNLFFLYMYIFGMSRTRSYTKVIGSTSTSQERNDLTSVTKCTHSQGVRFGLKGNRELIHVSAYCLQHFIYTLGETDCTGQI